MQQGIEQGIQKGIERGIEQGIQREKSLVIRLLQRKIGQISKQLKSQI